MCSDLVGFDLKLKNVNDCHVENILEGLRVGARTVEAERDFYGGELLGRVEVQIQDFKREDCRDFAEVWMKCVRKEKCYVFIFIFYS